MLSEERGCPLCVCTRLPPATRRAFRCSDGAIVVDVKLPGCEDREADRVSGADVGELQIQNGNATAVVGVDHFGPELDGLLRAPASCAIDLIAGLLERPPRVLRGLLERELGCSYTRIGPEGRHARGGAAAACECLEADRN